MDWQKQRAELARRIEGLRAEGICDTCHNLATGEPYGNHYLISENALFRVALEMYPRARGHTIVIYKPHRADLSELTADEAGLVFQTCVQMVNAIKRSLGAEKVYLNTMCDGVLNHLHLQLFPRYAGEPVGSRRFVEQRGPIQDGDETVRLIRAALETYQPGIIGAP